MENNIEITSKVYNALADIMFETGASKEDMEQALKFFNEKFWEIDEDEDAE